jgi:hypothetical protein
MYSLSNLIFNLTTNTSYHLWPDHGNPDNYGLRDGTNLYIAQLHLVELIAEISEFLGQRNYRNGKWSNCEVTDCSTDWNKNVNIETVTMKPEHREEILVLENVRYI